MSSPRERAEARARECRDSITVYDTSLHQYVVDDSALSDLLEAHGRSERRAALEEAAGEMAHLERIEVDRADGVYGQGKEYAYEHAKDWLIALAAECGEEGRDGD